MSPLKLHRPGPTPTDRPVAGLAGDTLPLAPLLVDVRGFDVLLSRSLASLHLDDAAGRSPAALCVSDINAWVELGCPPRAEFQTHQNNCR